MRVRPPSRQKEGKTLTTRRTSVIIAALITALLVPVPSVLAAPVSAKRSEAQKVRSQVAALDSKVEMAAEEYNEAQAKYLSATRKASATRKELAGLKARIGDLNGSLGERAAHTYKAGPTEMVELLLSARDFGDLATTWDLLRTINEQEASMVAELKAARERVTSANRELELAENAARKQRDVTAAKKSSILKQLAQRKKMLSGLESEIAAIEASERAAAEARAARAKARAKAAAAAARAKTSSSSRSTTKRAARGGVVGIALSLLGRPYRWAAAGPNSFDCSGFTMYVYRQVGVSLPHSSRAQINCGERVSRSELRPGDLVFFGRSRIHHVGIYIGGGDFVHAPSTGDVVKVTSLSSRSDYAGACRP